MDIEVIDNDITEGPEQFFVSLSAPFGATGIIIQPNSTATVTILDDDGMYKTQTCLFHMYVFLNYMPHFNWIHSCSYWI